MILRLLLIVLGAGIFTAAVRADDLMGKFVVTQESPLVQAGSPAAQPKTLYRWGRTKGRVEQPAVTGQTLIIIDGKDAWLIDETARTGRHFIDPEPDNTFYSPIVPVDATGKSPVRDFEIGRELTYMGVHNVSPEIVTEDDQDLVRYEYEDHGFTLRFFTAAKGGTPVRAEVWQNHELVVRLVYREYSWNLPPDAQKFSRRRT